MITVLGDCIFDCWLHVECVGRYDPALGIPVMESVASKQGAGGAGAVAAMIRALGEDVRFITVVSEENVESLRELLTDCEVVGIAEPEREDTVKLRLCQPDEKGVLKHVFRIDTETTEPITPETEQTLLCALSGAVQDGSDLLVVADYAKGVMTRTLAEAVCRNEDWTVFVDPGRCPTPGRYRGSDVVKCSEGEAGDWSPRQIAERLRADTAIVTSGEDGCEWWSDSVRGHGGLVRGHAVEEIDPTGCGDQFLAALAVAEYRGVGTIEAVEFANRVAAVQATRNEIVPVTARDIQEMADDGCEHCGKVVGA